MDGAARELEALYETRYVSFRDALATPRHMKWSLWVAPTKDGGFCTSRENYYGPHDRPDYLLILGAASAGASRRTARSWLRRSSWRA